MNGAALIAKIRTELKECNCDLDKQQKQKLALGMIDAGFLSLRACREACAKGGDINSISNIDPPSKAFLRSLIKGRHDEDHDSRRVKRRHDAEQEGRSETAHHARKEGGKTASAETVLQSVEMAASMRVERAWDTPCAMIKVIGTKHASDSAKKLFNERARLEAICGNMVSIKATSTALRCWKKFAVLMGFVVPGEELPPPLGGLLAWTRIFRSKGTCANYMSKLSFACEIAGVSRKNFNHPSVKRAKGTVGSLEAPPKPKRGIRMEMLELLVTTATAEGDLVSALLYILSYSFLLRVPSEGLPMEIGVPGKSMLPLPQGGWPGCLWESTKHNCR